MSILIKGNNGIGGSSGSGKGFPIGNVLNLKINNGSKNATIYWSDPDDSIYNNIILSTWSSTIIVRKEGSAPTSIKDGIIILENTERNKYKETPYTDSNVEIGKTYYYRFYTVSTDKVYNDSSDMIRNVTIKEYDPILKNNSWETINTVSEAGSIPETWNVGDEIDITLSGDFNETITLQIWDFNHYYGSAIDIGLVGICFGTKNLTSFKYNMNTASDSQGGWNNTYIRNYVMEDILKSMPSELRNRIQEVHTFANKGSGNTEGSYGLLSKDKVFLPGFTEIFGSDEDLGQFKTEQNQSQFPIFTNNNSRIKKSNNGSGNAGAWWTRSPCYNDNGKFKSVGVGGSPSRNEAYDIIGICFCFNV